MIPYNAQMKPHQKDLVQNFREFTNCRPETAEAFLKKTNWDFNAAINNFFEQGYVEPAQNVSGVFDKYKNKDAKIDAQGLVNFFEDIGVSPTDPICGYLMYIMKAKESSEIQAEQFNRFCNYVGFNTIDKIKASITNLRTEFKDPKTFKEVYNYLFDLYKDNPKFVKFEVAMALWQVYLQGRFHYYNQFMAFMENHNKPISRDIWKMVYMFQFETKGDLNNYKESDGWPVLIDNFVQQLKSK